MSQTLLIGDPHFKKDNVLETRIFVEELEGWLQRNSPRLRFIVVMGDLLDKHERVYTPCRNRVEQFIMMLRNYAEVWILVGNHDYPNNEHYFCSDQHWMNALKQWDRVTIVDRPMRIEEGIIGCPYVPPGRFAEALDTLDGEWKDAKAIYCHQEIYGCKNEAGFRSDRGDVWPRDAPMLYAGHYHGKQRPQPNVYYVGSILQHKYDENPDKSLLVVEHGEWVEEVFLNLPTKQTLVHTVDTILDATIPPAGQTKIKITGTKEEIDRFKKSKCCKQLKQQGVALHLIRETEELDLKDSSFTELLREMISNSPNPQALQHLWNRVEQGSL